MGTFKIIKKGANNFWHWYNSDAKKVYFSDFEITLEEVSQTFIIITLNGANVPQQAVSVLDIEVIDETDASLVETFTNVADLRARLVELGYTAILSANGIQTIVAGTNITIDNTDPANPIISATGGGGGGAVDSVNGQTGVVVLDATDVGAEPTITSGTTSQYFRGDKTFQTLNKSTVGLGNVVNADTTTTANITDSTNKRFVTDANLVVIGNTSGTNTGDNATNTTSNAYADAKVADAINDGTTTIAPSQNAVFDALALKSDKSDFEDWTSFAGSSTVTSWASPTISFLQYTRAGKVLTIRGRITGTSNSASNPTITIPFTLANLGAGQGDLSLLYVNNGISSTTPGAIVGADNSNIITFFRDGGFATGWTGSGTKTIAFLSTFIIQ